MILGMNLSQSLTVALIVHDVPRAANLLVNEPIAGFRLSYLDDPCAHLAVPGRVSPQLAKLPKQKFILNEFVDPPRKDQSGH